MFTTTAAVVFTVLSVIWSKKGGANVVAKIFMTALAIWGIVEAIMVWGFILAPQSI